MFPKLFALGLTLLPLMAEQSPRFMPENTGAAAHPIVTAVKVIGMIATAIFVLVMVRKSINVVKNDEDDKVDLPD